jgi:heme exporter protein A
MWVVMPGRSIKAEQLHLWRGDNHVLSGIELCVNPGEILLVTGANGSGKTSLLRALCGLAHPEDGRILWGDRNVQEDLREFHAELVYLGHEPPLKGDLTARENLRYWIGVRRTLTMSELDAALARVGAEGWSEQPVRTLSAGQKRRVAIAGVLLFAAPLWLLDEPATNLDVDGQRLVSSLIDEHVGAGGLVIAAVHHELGLKSVAPQRLELSLR